MEATETFSVVIRREGLEETGLELRKLRDRHGVIIGEEFFVTRKGHWCHSIHVVFQAELTRNTQNFAEINPEKAGERIRKMAWIELKNLRETDILPMFQEFIRRLKREAKIPEQSVDQTSTPEP